MYSTTDCDSDPCRCDWLSHRTLYSEKRQMLEEGRDSGNRYTYDSNDPTDPLAWRLSVHYPYSMTEVSLNDKRDTSAQKGKVYGGEMGMREAFHIPKSGNKPIIDVGPSECGLNSLQQEHEISCTNLALLPRYIED